MIRLSFVLLFLFSVIKPARSQVDDTDAKLRGLFFDLDINATHFELAKEVKKKLYREFAYVGMQDTFRLRDTLFTIDHDLFPAFKLRDPKLVPLECDSVILLIQPAFVWEGSADHPSSYRTKPSQLYGHLISLHFFFADSLKVKSAYYHFKDSLCRTLNKQVDSGKWGSEQSEGGEISTFKIDELQTRYNYKRQLELSTRHYPDSYELMLQFEKLTLVRERRKK